MKIALLRIFWKNLPILLVILLAFVGLKAFSAHGVLQSKTEYRYLDSWIRQCQTYDDAQLDAFHKDTRQKISDDKNLKKAAEKDWSAFSSSYGNAKHIRQLIGFAQNKEGMLPTSLPNNYFELLDYYSAMDPVKVINEQPLNLYFKLQSSDVTAILTLLLCAVVWGAHYETEVWSVCYGQ